MNTLRVFILSPSYKWQMDLWYRQHCHSNARKITTADDDILEMSVASVYIKTMTTNDVQESWRGRFEPLTRATLLWRARGHLKTWDRGKNWKWDWASVLTSVLFSSCAERPQRNALCLQLWLIRFDRLEEMQHKHWCRHLKSHRRSVKSLQ